MKTPGAYAKKSGSFWLGLLVGCCLLLPPAGFAQMRGRVGGTGAGMAPARIPPMPHGVQGAGPRAGGPVPAMHVPRVPPAPATPPAPPQPVPRQLPRPYARPPIRMQEPVPSSPMAPPRTPTPRQLRLLTPPSATGPTAPMNSSGAFVPAFGVGTTTTTPPARLGGRGVDAGLFPFFRLRHPVVLVGPEVFFFSPGFFCNPFLFGFFGSPCFFSFSPFCANVFFFDPFLTDFFFDPFFGLGNPLPMLSPFGLPSLGWLWTDPWLATPGWTSPTWFSPLQTSVLISNGVLPGLTGTAVVAGTTDAETGVSDQPSPPADQEDAAAESAAASTVHDPQPGQPVTLVFTDGTTTEAVRYWLGDDWMVHFELPGGQMRTVPLDRLDLLATMSVNLRQGIRFFLPPIPQPR